MSESNRLSALKVTKINSPGRYADGGGLYLRVAEYQTKTGLARSKNWLFRFERDGRERFMGLGSLDTLSLADARQKARDCRKLLLDGLDPIEDRLARRAKARVERGNAIPFKACAESYITAHWQGWKNPKHAVQWPSTLATYVYPKIGAMSVAAIDTPQVLRCLEPIWHEKPDTAGRVRGRIEAILDWAKAREYRVGENPARWRGHLDKLLARRSKIKRVRHHPALPYGQMPEFMAALRARNEVSSRALEFCILTAARTSEAIKLTQREIDFKTKLWTVPATRMKGNRPHIVPLSERAVSILKAMQCEHDEFVFSGRKAGNSISDMTMLRLLHDMQHGITVHGFRSTFRDWAGDQTNYPTDVVEAALAHVIVDETEAAYRRSTAVQKRIKLMADWAKFCSTSPGRGGNVLSIGKRATQ